MNKGGRPTEAQNKARARNWRIRNLRSLHAVAGQLTGLRRSVAQDAIDEELELLGAKSTADHAIEVGERFDREWLRRHPPPAIAESDIPF